MALLLVLFECGFQIPDIDNRVEEQTTMKAARTARRVWLKRLAHNTFSKPEHHWRPKLEAELYDTEQNKVVLFIFNPYLIWTTSQTVYYIVKCSRIH